MSIIGGVVTVLLAASAQFVPIEEAFRLGALSLKINSSLSVLGRILQIRPAEGSLLAIDLWRGGLMVLRRRGIQNRDPSRALWIIDHSVYGRIHRGGTISLCRACSLNLQSCLPIPMLTRHQQTTRTRRGPLFDLSNARDAVHFICRVGCWQVWKPAREILRWPHNRPPCWDWDLPSCWRSFHFITGSPCSWRRRRPSLLASYYGSFQPSRSFSAQAFLTVTHGCAPPLN